jgi:hypothetical protein
MRDADAGQMPTGVDRDHLAPRASRSRGGAVLHLAGQLAAGGVDVVAAGLADGGHDAGVLQHARKGQHAFARRALQARLPGTG